MSAPELWVDIADLMEIQDWDEFCGRPEEAPALSEEGVNVVTIERLLDEFDEA